LELGILEKIPLAPRLHQALEPLSLPIVFYPSTTSWTLRVLIVEAVN
jgi:hypothetical protein